jgi:ribosomal protein S18 acetylase RimI-like enzyme
MGLFQREVTYRPLCPQDFSDLKALHEQLFPLDYEDNFYSKAVGSQEHIFSWAAFVRQGSCDEQLVGFVTARTCDLAECNPTDRHAMGLASKLLDDQKVVYILTLGVAPGHRKQGIASQLLQRVVAKATRMICRAVYLHVVSYNTAAISFYERNYFQSLCMLKGFYHIQTGRQPIPEQVKYDAY